MILTLVRAKTLQHLMTLVTTVSMGVSQMAGPSDDDESLDLNDSSEELEEGVWSDGSDDSQQEEEEEDSASHSDDEDHLERGQPVIKRFPLTVTDHFVYPMHSEVPDFRAVAKQVRLLRLPSCSTRLGIWFGQGP